jgi:hypothetical protein
MAWRWFGLGPVLAFWSCYVLTRPLGTSIALRLAAGRNAGGPGLGPWPVSAGLAVGAAIMVTYLALSRRDALAPGIAASGSLVVAGVCDRCRRVRPVTRRMIARVHNEVAHSAAEL